MNIYYDTEFTGLHQLTTLISIGLIADNGREFYAEMTDCDKNQLDDWLLDNVMPSLLYASLEQRNEVFTKGAHTSMMGNKQFVGLQLRDWLSTFDKIDLWSDTPAYDHILLVDLLGGTEVYNSLFSYYQCFDIATLFKFRGIDPDISREGFAGVGKYAAHNALDDARLIRICYHKLMDM